MIEKLDLSKEEGQKSSSSKPLKSKKSKTLYVVNFTSRRIALFFVSCVSLIIFIFSIGFHLGNSKESISSSDNSMSLLMREDVTAFNSMTVPAGSEDVSKNIETTPENSDIIDMTTLSQPGNNSAIERSDPSSYNEYTSNLANELNSIKDQVKDGLDQTPNTSYVPPKQNTYPLPDGAPTQENLYPLPDAQPPVQFGTSTVTKVPYGATSSEIDVIYFIQVAVGQNKDFSYAARDKLKQNHSKAFVVEETLKDGSTMYKLKVGRYATKKEAESALASIKKNPEYRGSYIYTDKKK